jgi:hypothetical protein
MRSAGEPDAEVHYRRALELDEKRYAAQVVSDKPAESCAVYRRAHRFFQAEGAVGVEYYAKADAGVAACGR